MKPKVGLITFGDHREDMWKKVFAKHAVPLHWRVVEILKQLPIEVLYSEEVSRTREQINAAADQLKSQGAEVLLAHVPCWTSPNLVVHVVQRRGLYTIVLGNEEPGTHGCVGLLGASGALGQIGYSYENVRSDYDADEYTARLMPVLRAASVKEKLKGSVFGLFGGRSIGIDTVTFDPMQWKQQFGVDSEHIDQLEIVRLAETISQDRIDKTRKWLETGVKRIHYNDDKFTREKFDYQIACYLATKDLIVSEGLDFTAIKCMPDLSTHYVPQCMTQMLLACDSDAEGKKDTTAIACEADADGALTQQILRILSGGKPTFFADVSHIDNKRSTIYCVNCGALCAYYGARSAQMDDNLGKIELKQSVRPGGAGISCFYAASGPMQLARLYRRKGKYKMAIIPCEAITPPQEVIDEFVEARGPHQLPTLFAQVNFDLDNFVSEYGSNHISGVEGYYLDELVKVCHLLDIEAEVFV